MMSDLVAQAAMLARAVSWDAQNHLAARAEPPQVSHR
jgi:hypothetical protein